MGGVLMRIVFWVVLEAPSKLSFFFDSGVDAIT
jgi:hypothetical protein